MAFQSYQSSGGPLLPGQKATQMLQRPILVAQAAELPGLADSPARRPPRAEIVAPAVARVALSPLMALIWLAIAFGDVTRAIGTDLRSAWRALADHSPNAASGLAVAGVAILAGGALAVSGFPIGAIVAGAALPPLLWGWLWLTLRLPLPVTPLGALIAGETLYLTLIDTRRYWETDWTSLTAGSSPAGRLDLWLPLLPAALLGWRLAADHWPERTRVGELAVAGAVLWFLFERVWIDWQPAWEALFAPARLAPPAGLLLLALPLGSWLWWRGARAWPLPFAALHLLLLGGGLALAAVHFERHWLDHWQAWTGPLAGAPILFIALGPLVAGAWDEATCSWPEHMLIPNLLLLGTVAWFVLDRTQFHWASLWGTAWGDVPLRPSPAALALILPLAVWGWSQGAARWPAVWLWAWTALASLVILWVADRARPFWESRWSAFAGDAPDLTLALAPLPPLAILWRETRRNHRFGADVVGMTWLSVLLAWLTSRVWEDRVLPILFVGLLPLAAVGWWRGVQRHPRAGWGLTLLPLLAIAIVASVAPHRLTQVVGPVASAIFG